MAVESSAYQGRSLRRSVIECMSGAVRFCFFNFNRYCVVYINAIGLGISIALMLTSVNVNGR